MHQMKKPPFELAAVIVPILNVFLLAYGLLSPFLDLSDNLKIPLNNSWQLYSIGGGLLAAVSIAYLLIQTKKRQINGPWCFSLLVSIVALLAAVYLWGANPKDYQKEYRFRDCEYVDALTDQLDGWDYIDSDTTPTGEILYLDDWSTKKPEKGNAESCEQWRCRIRQTMQSSQQPTGDWTVDPNISPISNIGEWVDDSSALSGQNIESAIQYRYREVWTKTERIHDTWGWTTETPMEVKARYGSSVEIDWQTRETQWFYYQFYCHGCGRSQKDYDTCTKCRTIDKVEYYELWNTTSYDELSDRYGWVELDRSGDIYFANVEPGSAWYHEPKKEYKYTIIGDIPILEYGEWTDWSFNDPGDPGVNMEIERRTVFRTSEIIYTYYRWDGWSEWGTSEITQSSDKEVEHRILYRPYTEETKTVYHFSRWGDWSEWSLQEPEKKEGREIDSRWVKIPEEQNHQVEE